MDYRKDESNGRALSPITVTGTSPALRYAEEEVLP
jgi:hypothetical protein